MMCVMDPKIFSKIKKGAVIPEFKLKNTLGEVVSSNKYLRKNNLIIFFFNLLKDKCCADYLNMLNVIYEELRENNAEILVVCQEKLGLLKSFIEKNDVKFDILIDSDTKTINKFTYKDKEGNNICALFIADKFNSLYRSYLHHPFGELPDKGEIVSSIEFLEKQCPECGGGTWEA